MEKVITVKEASVKTAAVEVKSLVISGRQVTMSLFRQFLPAVLVDSKTADLRGTPWGFVNYYWKNCDHYRYLSDYNFRSGEHRHVVWQLGNELRRTCLYPIDFAANRTEEAAALETVIEASWQSLCYDMVEGRARPQITPDTADAKASRRFNLLVKNEQGACQIQAWGRADARGACPFRDTIVEWALGLHNVADQSRLPDSYEQLAHARRVTEARAWCASHGPRDRFVADFGVKVSHYCDVRAAVQGLQPKLTELKTSLDRLDQLFIAT